MVEKDSWVGSYTHLKAYPRPEEALRMLKRIASMVKPIMRKHGWKIGQLAEFDQAGLLGTFTFFCSHVIIDT